MWVLGLVLFGEEILLEGGQTPFAHDMQLLATFPSDVWAAC